MIEYVRAFLYSTFRRDIAPLTCYMFWCTVNILLSTSWWGLRASWSKGSNASRLILL